LEPCLFFRNGYNEKCNTRKIDSQITNDNLIICAMNQGLFVRKGGKYAFKRLGENHVSRENDGRYMLIEKSQNDLKSKFEFFLVEDTRKLESM